MEQQEETKLPKKSPQKLAGELSELMDPLFSKSFGVGAE
jgi:hypothetical protein